MNTDDKYIFHSLKAGMSPDILATKFNTTREDIILRAKGIAETSPALAENGVEDIVDAFTLTCLQYNKVGEGLKIIAEHMSDPASLDDIRKIVCDEDLTFEAIVQKLARSFIILKPFKAPALTVQEDVRKTK
jgi:hypothetical protein